MIPCFKYQDAGAAIEWLCSAFGFEKKMVVEGPEGKIAHAELTFGRGMVMLGSVSEDEFSKMVAGTKKTGAVYIVVEDCDAHFGAAKGAGAHIEMEPTDQDYGSRDYICRDPEGYLWCFGTYDPWRQ